MRLKASMLYATAAILSVAAQASAAECPVEKFTISDLERLKFSESLAISIIDTMESSQYKNEDRSFGAGILIKGVPFNVNYKDMKAISDYVKQNSSYNFSRDQQIDYLRTNVSIVGASMYSECLKRRTQNFEIEIPDSAYTEDGFILKMTWTPRYSAPPEGKAEIQVLNATVDGKDISQKAVKDKNIVNFVIRRTDPTKSIQIIPSVDGYDNGEDTGISIPPIIDPQYKTVLRTWPGPGDAPFQPMCGDDGGGHCGSGEKLRTECITADTGLLLPSTLAIESVTNVAAIIRPDAASSGSSVCVTFGTYGVNMFGKKGYSGLSSFAFSVREVVPILPTAVTKEASAQ